MTDPARDSSSELGTELIDFFPRDQLVLDPSELRVYECDAFAMHRSTPAAVLLCRSREDVIRAVRWCHERGVSFVPRGAGTGLSGGATAGGDSLLLDLGPMRRILELDVENRIAVVEPGVINLRISEAAEAAGFWFAPDPSSESACSIGGNVAENAGGPHCLKYGVTADHVLGLEVVLPDGEVTRLGGRHLEPAGPDLVSLFIGSEGTFGVVTEVTVRLTRRPPTARTFLALFADLALACRMVAEITRQGILPAALEIMDQRTIQAIEASVLAAGYPEEAAAILLIELDGHAAGMDEEEEKIRLLARECEALEFRVARDALERQGLWKARKAAFGAMGRIATDLYVLDGVVPRTRLEETLARFWEIADRHGVVVTNVFHAGDGNVHPSIAYDGRDRREQARVVAAGREMLQACVDAGGSITGEHGIGIEKRTHFSMLFDADDLRLQKAVKEAIDPRGLSNPEKIFPPAPDEAAESP